jgi:diacylglycerol kinase family enzyme
MRVLLLHNPTAGEADSDGHELIQAFTDAGHTVRYASSRGHDWRDALDAPLDAVVVAGGDGTVRKAAIGLAELERHDLPLAIIPNGVANNIARSVGGGITPHDLARARRARLPVAIARGPWGDDLFVESAGVGLAPLLEGPAEPTLVAGAERLLQLLEDAQPQRVAVEIDQRDASGDYFLVLAVSTRSIGPRLELLSFAEAAEPTLRVLLVGHAERAMLCDALDRTRRGERGRLRVETQAASEVVVDWLPGLGHVDDDSWPEDRQATGRVSLTIKTSLPVLVPALPEPAP